MHAPTIRASRQMPACLSGCRRSAAATAHELPSDFDEHHYGSICLGRSARGGREDCLLSPQLELAASLGRPRHILGMLSRLGHRGLIEPIMGPRELGREGSQLSETSRP
eukprot:2512329-Pyramimonas_sp.AAC.1